MAVRVEAGDSLRPAVYSQATKWVIDEYQQLHVVGVEGNLASYGKNCWYAVHHVTEADLKAVA